MKNRLRLEVDATSHLKLLLVEFHDYFLSTQLELPLIMEDLDGNLVPTLLTYGKRIDRYRWCYSTGPDWPNNIDIDTGLCCIAKHIAKICNATRSNWVSLLLDEIAIVNQQLVLKTRLPIADLDTFMCWQGFAIDSLCKQHIGPYQLERLDKHTALLKPVNVDACAFELIHTKNRAEGRCLYDKGHLDIGWGIGVPTEFFRKDDSGPFSPNHNQSPFVYTLQAGVNVPPNEYKHIFNIIKNADTSLPGVSSVHSRVIQENFTNQNSRISDLADTGNVKRPLYYTNYSPNNEMADTIIDACDLKLSKKLIRYLDLVQGQVDTSDGYTLCLEYPMFPGIWGRIPNSIRYLSKQMAPSRTHALATSLIAQPKADLAHVVELETQIDEEERKIVLGRLELRFRSKYMMPISPSGRFPLSNITE